jgi:hypothetical protein
MTSKFTELAIDCADPGGLARFWCSVLDYEVQDEDDGIVTIGSPMVPEGENHLGPVPPTLTFAHVPEGKTVKNRLHLDVSPTDRDQDEEVRRLLDLGARHADVGQGDGSWVVLADPEGNEFCVLAGRRPRPEAAHGHADTKIDGAEAGWWRWRFRLRRRPVRFGSLGPVARFGHQAAGWTMASATRRTKLRIVDAATVPVKRGTTPVGRPSASPQPQLDPFP